MSLTSVFYASCACTDTDSDSLEPALVAACKRGSAAHPGLEVDVQELASYLGARVSCRDELDAIAIEDLFLACACDSGNAGAIEAFQRRYGPEIVLAISKVPDALVMTDEIAQLVLAQVLFPDFGWPTSHCNVNPLPTAL
ncbi:MAG: hypothetical protein GY811_23090 [Myxococcales bacterium]|nr:hypothetical protein [Myxococcales bacterium]